MDELAEVDPLLLRATIDESSAMLPILKSHGFLEVRRVFEVSVDLNDLLDMAPTAAKDRDLESMSLQSAQQRVGDQPLVDLFLESYSQTSRLDPTTPARLSPSERCELLFGDEDLESEISTVTLRGDEPVGICPIFSAASAGRLEVGPVGMMTEDAVPTQVHCLQMLAASAQRARHAGYEEFWAELDSDASYSHYLYAHLPCTLEQQSISLAKCPRWSVTARKEVPG